MEVVELGVLRPDPLLHERDKLGLRQRLRAGRRQHLVPKGDARRTPVRLSPLSELLVYLPYEKTTAEKKKSCNLQTTRPAVRVYNMCICMRVCGWVSQVIFATEKLG